MLKYNYNTTKSSQCTKCKLSIMWSGLGQGGLHFPYAILFTYSWKNAVCNLDNKEQWAQKLTLKDATKHKSMNRLIITIYEKNTQGSKKSS